MDVDWLAWLDEIKKKKILKQIYTLFISNGEVSRRLVS